MKKKFNPGEDTKRNPRLDAVRYPGYGKGFGVALPAKAVLPTEVTPWCLVHRWRAVGFSGLRLWLRWTQLRWTRQPWTNQRVHGSKAGRFASGCKLPGGPVEIAPAQITLHDLIIHCGLGVAVGWRGSRITAWSRGRVVCFVAAVAAFWAAGGGAVASGVTVFLLASAAGTRWAVPL